MNPLRFLLHSSNRVRSSSAGSPTPGLALLALGIVFGDIGTSPLYALRECFLGTHAVPATRENVLGVVSLMLWTILLIVSVKYVFLVLRADNHGEGGILALMTLVEQGKSGLVRKGAFLVLVMGILGAALLFSDGIITPAISVLSAIEGLTVATPLFQPYIIPLAVITLSLLFAFQSKGTARIGALFGPIVLLWFLVLGVLGVFAIAKNISILGAVNPLRAIEFIGRNGLHSLATLSSVFLAVTGTEVLYADLGHFGRKPIRFAWYGIVLPGLLLNYFGQGAYLLGGNGPVDNLFYRIVPAGLLFPLVGIATAATVIASQAVISGAFSLTKQAVALGFWPRVQIRHTSVSEMGQVYVPFMNWCLFAGTVALIFGFKESGRLAGAYGIAVSGTMLITTILLAAVTPSLWSKRWKFLLPFIMGFFLIDISFLIANLLKIGTGGWIVLVIAAVIFISFKTWIDGREILRTRVTANAMPLDALPETISDTIRVPKTAVFLTANPSAVPGSLLHNMKHNMILHERTMITAVRNLEIPYANPQKRSEMEPLGSGIYRVILSYGFFETPDVPAGLRSLKGLDKPVEVEQTTYFLGRESLVIGRQPTMSMWRKRIFEFMSRNSLDASTFYKLPPNRVVELGSRIEL